MRILSQRPGILVFAVLLVAGLLCGAFVSACGSAAAPEQVPLPSLIKSPDSWRGQRIEVEGTLVQLKDPDGTVYGVVQDESDDRVGLKHIDPWQSLVGQAVDATGTLQFDPSFGWYLEGPTVKPVQGAGH